MFVGEVLFCIWSVMLVGVVVVVGVVWSIGSMLVVIVTAFSMVVYVV